MEEISDEFVCNICKVCLTNSVVTLCGHIFCWACLYGWMHNHEKLCLVCKNMLKKGTIIPIYRYHEEGARDGSIPLCPNAPLSLSIESHVSGGQDDGEGFKVLLLDTLVVVVELLVQALEYFRVFDRIFSIFSNFQFINIKPSLLKKRLHLFQP